VGGLPIIEEWLAWFLVRERERQLKQQELIREAALAQRRGVVYPLRPGQGEAAEDVSRRRRAA